jgi:hypothetical protein
MPHHRTHGVTAPTVFAVPPVPVVEHEVDLPRTRGLASDQLLVDPEQLHDACPLATHTEWIELPNLKRSFHRLA